VADASGAAASGSSARVSVSCTGSSGETCDVTASITAQATVRSGKVTAVTPKAKRKKTKRIVTLGETTVTIDEGLSQTVTVTLNRTGLKLLRTFHRLAAELHVSSGGSRVLSQKLNFKEPEKKRR
jgi:hypothetical protein